MGLFTSEAEVKRWRQSVRRERAVQGQRMGFWTHLWTMGIKPHFKTGEYIGPDELGGVRDPGHTKLGERYGDKGSFEEVKRGQTGFYNPWVSGDKEPIVKGLTGSLGERMVEKGIGADLATATGGTFTPSEAAQTQTDWQGRDFQWDPRWDEVLENAVTNSGGKKYTPEEINTMKEGGTIEREDDDGNISYINWKSLENTYGGVEDLGSLGGELAGGVDKTVRDEFSRLKNLDLKDEESLAYNLAFKEYRDTLPPGEQPNLYDWEQSPEYQLYKEGVYGERVSGLALSDEDISSIYEAGDIKHSEYAMLPQLLKTQQKLGQIRTGGMAYNPFARKQKEDVLSAFRKKMSQERQVSRDLQGAREDEIISRFDTLS